MAAYRLGTWAAAAVAAIGVAYLAALVAGCALLAASCSRTDGSKSETPQQAQESVSMSKVQQDLAVIAQARILFGHQSVGRNVLAGLDALIAEAGVPVRVVQIDGLPPDEQPGMFHSNIGQNGDPNGKCEVFSNLLTRPEKPAYDVALMKFCYADLDVHTPLGVDQMVDRYERTVRDIRTQRPDVRLSSRHYRRGFRPKDKVHFVFRFTPDRKRFSLKPIGSLKPNRRI